MFFALVVAGLLLAPKTALGVELFTAGTANPFSDSIESSDYGSSGQTGGSIGSIGVFWPKVSAWNVPLELRLQKVRQSTAWNDNKGLGEIQFRDGYRIEASEILLGYRWDVDPDISVSLLFGGGRSEIEYKTRENYKGRLTHCSAPVSTRHLSSQVDIRYHVPLGLEQFEFGLTGMFRLSGLASHTRSEEVSPATWYVNLPSVLPIPSMGVFLGIWL